MLVKENSEYTKEESFVSDIKLVCLNSDIAFIGEQIRLNGNKRYAYDCGIAFKDRKILLEFDGYLHYQNAIQIYRDFNKKVLAIQEGYELLRFPYWVQFTTALFTLITKIETPKIKITSSYPNGFIDSKALLPASFCSLGFKRFEEELHSYPDAMQKEVIYSLTLKEKELGVPIEYIYK